MPHLPFVHRSRRAMLASCTLLLLAIGCASGDRALAPDASVAQNAASDDAQRGPWIGNRPPKGEEPPPEVGGGTGLWLASERLPGLAMAGPAWGQLRARAAAPCAPTDLADQNNTANVCVLAKALVHARTGADAPRAEVLAALRGIAYGAPYNGRALALGRELAAYVIAADLIGLRTVDPALDAQFRRKLAELRTTPTSGGPRNLVECHEQRPNNWGTMCGASRIAIAAYLGDRADLDRAATVFRGYLGDRSAYAGFSYADRSWQCDPSRPVPINPAGCVRGGRNLDGVLPEEQRRGGGFTWPAPRENYVYEALQGALTQAMLLSRQGYDVWSWSDRALLRAFRWLNEVNGYAATGDDGWQPHVINAAYGSSFPAPTPSNPGKVLGWTDWTHGR